MTRTRPRSAHTGVRSPDPDYRDVPELLGKLAVLTVGSFEHRSLREYIVRRCLPLAEHIARRYDGRGEPRDDLVQTARLGLLNAIDRFDPDSGSDFLSFAVPTIMGEVKRYFRDSGWAVHVPRRLKESRAQVTSATAELSQRLGRAPTPTELARELGIDRQEVVESLIAAQCYQTRSLDAPVGGNDDDSPAIVDRLGDHDSGIDTVEFREALRPLVAELPAREQEILTMRFFGSQTQTQIAKKLGISQMHVSRLLARCLNQLRDGLTA
ncbi:SigB/SigF/SigG family RNA polymerase sigma factor [Mycobacterium sp. IDR2000157661]|uniref:SigB/SigF/SigG family RNA polymerase sigma factor n=1 Tax=Mycobacterium sp. IDR2000157661 TaxID=2867005 RepID=UPI001EEE9ECE|nr:SigB/SigF/SigG family RNA polymerase sigma factor [Mycobacterium sp. IDR2000157661]ULE34639.1 SigB/SigF/SigG family RNA polymerase sigma factor [Mycobacterium sp. IDR2000157661]